MKKSKVSFSFVLLLLIMAIFLSPFYVMIIGAFKPQLALEMMPPDLDLFKNLTLSNAIHVFTKTSVFIWLKNSALSAGGSTLLTCFVASCAGYAFARKEFPGRNVLFMIVIATMILPRQIMLIPNYLVAASLGLPNKIIGVALTSITAPFGTFLCRQTMVSIPKELTESADIDGCNEIRKFAQIVIPMTAPTLAALAIFSFIGVWNDYVWQSIMISKSTLYTIPLGLSSFLGTVESNTGYRMMVASAASVPMLAVFLIFQKYFIKGITAGSVKG